jgi:arylsulfatase A-like enzyme/Flp pilus assembly protein TadD
MSRKRRPEPAPAPPAPRRIPVRVVGLLVFLAAAGAFVYLARGRAAAPQAGPAATAPARDNVLLITLDTTRADRLGSYGYAGARTPHLDQLAREGVRFDHVASVAPITLPSHASIFTGLFPFEHGVRNNGNFYLAESHPTLATRLKQAGYRTGAFVSSFVLDRRYGLQHGFDVYDDRMEGAYAQVVTLEAERRGDRTALALGAWLDERAHDASAPFFAWLHLYDPHEPYRAPPPFRERFLSNPYDGEIAFTDGIVAYVLDRLRASGQLDRTLVVVTADHGESLGDHGEATHSMFVYESVVRVPLLVWRPGRVAPGVVSEPVRLIDVAPTILELVGAPALPAPHARSLTALLGGGSTGTPPPAYSETLLPKFYMNWAPLRALRDGRYKLIDAPRPELYDLQRDPAETTNLYDRQPATAKALRDALDRFTSSGDAMSLATLDREAMEKLAALGYIGAGAAPDAGASSAPAGDPKDFIALFNRLREANSAVRERRFEEALPILQRVLKEDPKNAFATLVLGSAYMGLGRNRDAVGQFRRYAELVPTSSYAHQWLAICHVRLGERDLALREAEAALALDPKFADAHVLKAGVLASQGRHADAVAELRSAIATDPAKPMLRVDLAKVLAESGKTGEARTEYETVLKESPDSVPALTGLGALLARGGDLQGAEGALRRAIAKDADAVEARLNLAQVLERSGRSADAAAEYRRIAEDKRIAPELRDVARRRLK